MNGLSGIVNSIGQSIKKDPPKWCSIGTIAGVIGVGIFSSWSMYKTQKKVNQKKELGIDVTKKEILKTAIPYYIPTVGATIATSVLSWKGYKIGHGRTMAALGLAYAASAALEKHKKIVNEKYGPKIAEEINREAENERLKEIAKIDDNVNIDKLNNDELWFVETFSGHVFRSTPEDIKDIESKLNHQMITTDWISVNEVFYYFDITPWKAGENLGWNEGTKIEFKIDHDQRNCVDLNIGGQTIKAIKVYIENVGPRYDSFGDFMHH